MIDLHVKFKNFSFSGLKICSCEESPIWHISLREMSCVVCPCLPCKTDKHFCVDKAFLVVCCLFLFLVVCINDHIMIDNVVVSEVHIAL